MVTEPLYDAVAMAVAFAASPSASVIAAAVSQYLIFSERIVACDVFSAFAGLKVWPVITANSLLIASSDVGCFVAQTLRASGITAVIGWMAVVDLNIALRAPPTEYTSF